MQVGLRGIGRLCESRSHRLPVACQPLKLNKTWSVVCMATTATSGGKAGQKRMVLWFRNDLRLTDNYIVNEAVQAVSANTYQEVLPVYVFDPRFFAVSPWGNPKTGAFRAKFLLESVTDLKKRLKAVGSDLLVTVGYPEKVIPALLQGSSSPLVLTMEETTSEELNVDKKVISALGAVNGKLKRVWGHTLYHMDDVVAEGGALPTSRGGVRVMSDVFTPFKEKVEGRCQVRREVPAPKPGQLPLPPASTPCALTAPTASSTARPSSLLDAAAMAYAAVPGGAPPGLATTVAGSPAATTTTTLGALLESEPQWESLPWPKGVVPPLPLRHPKAVLDFQGGETAALARLQYYLWDKDLLATYFDTRNGMLGGDYSTKFSPYLAHGCISPRTIYHAIKRYEKERVSNKSTYWVIFELIWRDFFKFFSAKHGTKIFFETGTSGLPLVWNNDPEVWQRWREGRTGLPLVDANMREMAQTGFMSNRGRQNVASHLVLDLGVDWRRGADLFESLLLDYDVASNWGNWVAAAGLTGGRLNLFNITKQSKDYDLQGDYIRTWIPELRNVPASRIHEPWLMSREEQARYGVSIGVDYPNPIPVSQYGRPHQGAGRSGDRYGNGARAQSAGGGGRGNGAGGYSRGGVGGGRGGGYSGASGGRGAGRPSGAGGRGVGKARLSEFERFG